MDTQTFTDTNIQKWLDIEQLPETQIMPLAEPVPQGSIHRLKMAAGTVIPVHIHPCDEYVYILKGTIETNEHKCTQGTFWFTPAHTKNGPHKAITEVELLTIRLGAMGVFNFGENADMKCSDQNNLPIVIQQSEKGNVNFDIYSRLLAERIVFFRGEMTEDIANLIVAQMLFLDAENPEKDITLYINSSGGSVTAAMAVYDTMNQIRTDICTVCIGTAAAIGAFLLSSGTKGKRSALPNARITIRQPSGGAEGTSDIEIAAKEILYLRESINRILAANTGKSKEQIERDSERDFFMGAEEAKAYGLVDNIIMKTS